MRVFIAVKFSDEIKDKLDETRKELEMASKRGNFTRKENYHLTLKFIGEVAPDEIDDIARCVSFTASRNKAFSFTLSRTGYFLRPNAIIPWVGVDDNGGLKRLVMNLERELEKFGYKKERRSFSPHITLGREVQFYPDKKNFMDKLEFEPVEVKVEEISLMESVRMGPKLVYKPLFTASLKR